MSRNFEYDIDLIENSKFEISRTRRIDYCIRGELKKEFNMVEFGVIKPTRNAIPVLSPMVVRQKNKSIKFMKDIFSEKGNALDASKVEAINKRKTPSNATEIQRLLGRSE